MGNYINSPSKSSIESRQDAPQRSRKRAFEEDSEDELNKLHEEQLHTPKKWEKKLSDNMLIR